MSEQTKEIANFDAIKATADAALVAAEAMIITDQVTAEAASLRRKELKEISKRVEAKRKELVKPFDDGKAAIQKQAKGISDPLDKADEDLTKKLLAYQNELIMRAEAIAAEERAAAEARAAEVAMSDDAAFEEVGQAEERVEVAAAPVKLSKSEKLVSTRMDWKYRVVDKMKLPPELLIPDTAEIYKRVKAGARVISGCEIYEEEVPTGR